ncbi:MAG: hypothetical protein ACAH95_09970 [Fimbriimonas sp.]
MKLPIIVASALCLTSLPAQTASPRQIERFMHIEHAAGKYTVKANGMEVKLLLSDLFALTDRTAAIEWDVNGTITEEFEGLDFETALQKITRQVDSTYEVKGGAYRVRRRIGDIAYMRPIKVERKYLIEAGGKSIDVINVDSASVQAVLRDLSEIFEIPIYVSPAVKGEVTMQLRSVRFDVALDLILRQVEATYTRDDKGIIVKPKTWKG